MNRRIIFFNELDKYSYEDNQIGQDKQTIIKIYDYLKQLNIRDDFVEYICYKIAYLDNNINIPLYLELLTKSLGFTSTYHIEEICNTILKIHDIYKDNIKNITLDEYINLKEEQRIKNIFLDDINKYVLKSFKQNIAISYIAEIKFAAAIMLEQKDYLEFVSYIDDYETIQETYSPLILIRTYMNIRDNLKGESKLFWDILFGNEYLVSLTKNNIPIKKIFTNNILDIISKTKLFQLNTIYNSKNLPKFNTEFDYITFYRSFNDNEENITLPKLRTITE